MKVQNKTGAGAVLVYMVGALMVTGGGIADVGALLVGVAAMPLVTSLDDFAERYRSRWRWLTAALFITALVAWLALPWLLWWAR